MNQSLVLAEWKRSVDCLGAGHSCLRDRFYADATSRAYYAVLHAAKAALQARDVAAESHTAVKRLFGLHVVKTGLVEAEWAAYIGDSLDARLMADYDVESTFSDEDAREECERAKSFLVRIRTFLQDSGMPEDELRTDFLEPDPKTGQ